MVVPLDVELGPRDEDPEADERQREQNRSPPGQVGGDHNGRRNGHLCRIEHWIRLRRTAMVFQGGVRRRRHCGNPSASTITIRPGRGWTFVASVWLRCGPPPSWLSPC